MSIERLIQEHEQLEALAARLEACVSKTAPDAASAIAVKSRLATELASHLAGEDAAIYPRLATSTDATLIDTADRLRRELVELKHDWNAYLTEWSDDTIEGDWPHFGEETRTMMSRLRARIARENALLLPHALQRSVVRLRAAA